jgi:hypothetical protein
MIFRTVPICFSFARRLTLPLAILLRAIPAEAQWTLDLTGAPAAMIAEPFTHLAGVRELAGHRAVVSDQMERRLILVDFATGSTRQLGREGEGPGEYRFPMAPLAGRADTTFVLDAVLRRLLVLLPTGEFSRSLSPPYGAVSGGFAAARGTDGAGRIYFEGNSFDSQSGRFSDSVSVFRWEPGTNRVDPIARFWTGGRILVSRGTGTASVARSATPFPALDAWGVLPDGRIAIVQHAPYRLIVTGAGDSPVSSPPLAFTPIPVTAAERDAYRAREEGVRMRSAGGGEAVRRPPTPDGLFPSSMPPFIAASVLVSPDGQVWIGKSFAHSDRMRNYDVLDASGRLVGRAKTTTDRAVVGFGARAVYVARTDPADHLVYLEQFAR